MAKSSTKTLTLLVFAAIVGIGYGAPRMFDRLWLPWAYPRGGGHPLPGVWVGSLTTATGRRFGVLLDLRLKTYYNTRRGRRDWRSSPYGSFEGVLRSCDARGETHNYSIDGAPNDRRAAKLHFHAAPAEKPPHQGPTFSWFKGNWDGADNLDLNANIFVQRGNGAVSGDEFPDTQSEPTLALRRGADTDYQTLCARLASGGV